MHLFQATEDRPPVLIPCILWCSPSSTATRPPRPQNDQIINRNLKRLGQLMELTDVLQIERTVGGAKTGVEDQVGHADLTLCQRSFCTNNYLMGTDADHYGHLRPQDRSPSAATSNSDRSTMPRMASAFFSNEVAQSMRKE